MSTKFSKRKMIASDKAFEEICSWAPKGWSFFRATKTIQENDDVGVRVFFQNKPVGAPGVSLKPGAEAAFARPVTQVHYLQGKDAVELKFDDGTNAVLPRQMANSFIDVRPERRPNVRLLSEEQIKNHAALDMLIRAHAIASGMGPRDVLLDVFLPMSRIRELFNLGENVHVLGVRGEWEGEPIPGRGVCKRFRLRVAERG